MNISLQSPQFNLLNQPTQNSLPEVQKTLSQLPCKSQLLEYSVTVYMPTINPEQTEKMMLEMAKWGGFSCFPIQGGWESPTDGLIVEEILLIKAFTDWQGLNQQMETLFHWVYAIGQACNQEAMAVEISSPTGSQMVLIYMN